MAKVKFGSIVTDMMGKLGGQIYSRNNGGSYVKNFSMPFNPASDRQVQVRTYMAENTAAWKALTQSEREAWKAFAVNFPRNNNVGNGYRLSGYNAFMFINQNLKNAQLSATPVPLSLQTPTPIFQFSTEIDTGTPYFNIGSDDPDVPADSNWLIRCTPSLSLSNNSYSNLFSQVYVIPAGTLLPVDIWAQYIAMFGVPVVGMKVATEVKPVHIVSGIPGGAVVYEIVVA